MKKWLSILLCLMLLFTTSVPCFANNHSVAGPGGALPPTAEELAEAEAAFNPDLLELYPVASSRAVTWYGPSNMTYYAQQQSMSCGPACVRMVLKYITGTTYAESTIINGMVFSETTGTTLGNLTNYLKSHSDRYYTNYYGNNQTYLMSGVSSSIRNFDSPPIIGVVSSTSLGFPVTGSGGHFLVIEQIKSDLSAVMILDPWSGYSGNGYNGNLDENYTITANNMMTAYNTPSTRLGIGMQLSETELTPNEIVSNETL